ncbi:MAG: glycosyltransferase family 39 protein [Deltaproteobacteria bacterium]|nr:glycosyltransferase family 39 protein [Deltaproteobacteria bacterium]
MQFRVKATTVEKILLPYFLQVRNKKATKSLKTPAQPASGQSTRQSSAGLLLNLLLILLVLFVHLHNLEHSPPGAYVDESSIGYNAYSILKTGADEHGVTMPLFFKAFGEYKNPIFIYSLVPLIKVFGLSVWTIRLGAALFGLAMALVMGLIAKESAGQKTAWVAGFALSALTPWLFTLSRITFEVISLPFLIALGWWSWLRGTKSHSVPWFLLSWLSWGLSLFAYSTGRLMIPILVLVLIACYVRELKASWTPCAIGSIPFIICLALLLSWTTQNPGTLTARFEEISIWNDHPNLPTAAARFLGNYLSCLSPQFLFLRGDPNLRHHTGQGGMLFLFSFPLLLAGIVCAWQKRQEPSERFMLIAFFLFPLAASLTKDSNHALRTANALPFVIILIFWGAIKLREWLSDKRLLTAFFAAFAILEMGFFYIDYFHTYPIRARGWFNAGLPEALAVVFEQKRGEIYYSPMAFRDEGLAVRQPYIQFLFFGKLDPAVYQKNGLAGFNIHAYREDLSLPAGSLLLTKDGEEVFTASSSGLVLAYPAQPPAASELVGHITIPSPGVPKPPSYRIYRVP